MSPSDFDRTLRRYIDDDLSVDERRRFDAYLAAHPSARAAAEDERRLDERFRQSLRTPLDADRRDRLLSGFRRSADDVSRFRRPVWRWAATAAAAVVIFCATWQFATEGGGERRPSTSSIASCMHEHHPIVQAIHTDIRAFYGRVGDRSADGALSEKALAVAMHDNRSALTWIDGDVSRADRFASVHRELKRQGVPSEAIPALRGSAQIVGFRIADVIADGARHRVPHFVFLTERGEVSVYVLDSIHAPSVFSTLDPTNSDSAVEMHLHECPECEILARRLGSHVLVVFSSMDEDDLRQVTMNL